MARLLSRRMSLGMPLCRYRDADHRWRQVERPLAWPDATDPGRFPARQADRALTGAARYRRPAARSRGGRAGGRPRRAHRALPDWVADVDLLVLRGLAGAVLARLDTVDTRCCNSPRAVRAVNDRWWLAETLRAAGVPTSASRYVEDWSDVLDAAGDVAVVVKAVNGFRGVLPAGALPPQPPFAGPHCCTTPYRLTVTT